MSPSPVVANWELVLRIRARREQLGLSVTELARRLGFTHNYWSAIENERKIIPENILNTLLKLLEFGTEDGRQLLELRRAAKKRGWWTDYAALFDGNIQRMLGLEHGAQQIHGYETLLIPGLLQTDEYARAIMNSDTSIRAVEVEQRVEVRLSRQRRLRGVNPIQLTVIFSEAALWQQVGGATVLRKQLDHLLEVIEQHPDNIRIQVVPFTTTACNLFGAGTLNLLDFQSPRLPRVAWHETVSTWGFIIDPNKVRDITMAFDETRRRALDQGETKRLIEKHRKEFR